MWLDCGGNAYRTSVAKPIGKRTLGRPRKIRGNNIEICLRKIRFGDRR
jgi:hypothetical protein